MNFCFLFLILISIRFCLSLCTVLRILHCEPSMKYERNGGLMVMMRRIYLFWLWISFRFCNNYLDLSGGSRVFLHSCPVYSPVEHIIYLIKFLWWVGVWDSNLCTLHFPFWLAFWLDTDESSKLFLDNIQSTEGETCFKQWRTGKLSLSFVLSWRYELRL